jgi:hypothetical protein
LSTGVDNFNESQVVRRHSMKIYEMLCTNEPIDSDPQELESVDIDIILDAMDTGSTFEEVADILNKLEVPGYIARSILSDTYDRD